MEWIIILVIALLIFGPKNLPKLGASLGKTVKNIREGMSGEDEAAEEPESEEDKEIRELEAKLAEAKAKKEESPVEED
nr:twin-arginine translocase TatA/TatE family subunit [Collinsella tanakaei]